MKTQKQSKKRALTTRSVRRTHQYLRSYAWRTVHFATLLLSLLAFTTSSIADTLTIHPLSTASNAGAWTITTPATDLDANDGDATAATKCCSGPTLKFYMDMDDPAGLAGATINSITTNAVVRCSAAGVLTTKVGYMTDGATTVWTGAAACGTAYATVTGGPYTLDSAGGALDLTDLNNIQVAVDRVGTGPTNMLVTELYVTIDYTPAAGPTTTLATGTDPGNSTIAPGGAATNAGAFSFQTSSGTDVITDATVTLAAGTSGGLSLVEITSADGATVYGSASNPASDTPVVTLSTNTLTATTTLTEYRIRVTPKSHANMPAPAGSSYAVTARISAFTGTNTQAGSDTAGTTITVDNLSTGNVTAATATASSGQVALAWTNPADADKHSIIVLRRTGGVVGDTPVEGTTYVVNDTIGSSTVACVVASPGTSCNDSGLSNGTAYYYKIFVKDTNGNYSATGVVPTGSPATPGPRICVPSMFDASCNSSQTTLALAITAATSGVSDIYVQAGTYSENINYGGKNITILSASGAATTTIRGSGANNPVVTFSTSETSAAVLNGFTIDNQSAANTLTRGIYVSGAAPTIQNTIITGNLLSAAATEGGAGVYINNSSPTFTSVTIKANNAPSPSNGCGIYIKGAAGGATISGSTIGGTAAGDGNLCSGGSGGGIYYTGSTTGTLSISGSNIQYNQGNSNGGGIFATTITNQITVTSTTIRNNFTSTTADGGGVYVMSSTPISLDGVTINNNAARSGSGILVFNGADVTMTNNTVIDNNDTNNCAGGGDGGGIYATSAGSTVTMTGGSITNNSGRWGGGIYVTSSADVALTGVTINSNSSSCANPGGGIHANGGTLTADRVKIRGNSASNGGGVYLVTPAVVTIRNSDITGNTATADGGGAMTFSSPSTLNIYNSTVAGNYAGGATGGGGIRNTAGTLNITNGIVYGNTSAGAAGISTAGTTTITYSSYQAISGACTGCTNNRTVGENPLFVTLAQAGAGTPTTAGDFHLQGSSPVINQGTNNALTPDIDGDARPLNGAYEMGSDERAGLTISGTLYSDEGTTVIATGPTVRLVANGVSIGTAVANGSGVYSITGGVSAGDAILVYIDSAGATLGTTVTVSDGTNLSGLNIYQNRVITRHDNSGSLTNALMSTAKGAYVDTDILYSVSGGNLTANGANTELFVWAGHTFASGGTITTTHMDINGTLDAAANAINVAGNWDATGGVFTSTGTVTFNAASGTATITPGGVDADHDFQNIVFNDAAGTATFQLGGAIDVDGDFTVTDGIFDTTAASSYAVTVAGTLSDSANGRFKANASTITVGGDVSLNANNDATESTDWNSASLVMNGAASQLTYTSLNAAWNNGFNNLSAGVAGVTDTINSSLAIQNDLTIGTGGLTGAVTLYMRGSADVLFFDAASTLTLTNLMFLANAVNFPTLANGYNTDVTLGGVGPQTVTQTGAVTLSSGKHLKINGDGVTTRSNSLNTGGFALTVGGDLIIGAGVDTGAKGLTANNSTITVTGNFTVNTGTNTFTAGTSTVVLNGTNQTITGSTTFNNLTKSVATARTLTFAAGSTTTVNGIATLNGASGQLLSLASSSPGTRWNFTLGAASTKAISYVSVTDSDASGSDASKKPVSPTNSTDGGNNVSWFPMPSLTFLKTVTVTSDPVNGATNPKYIPGAEVLYTLRVTNSGAGTVDNNTLVITDPIPANTELFTGNLSGGAPFVYTNGTPTSGLSCAFTALNNFADCMDFSDDSGATWAYVPNGSFDPAVTHIRFSLSGTMNGTGGGNPYFDLNFRVRVK